MKLRLKPPLRAIPIRRLIVAIVAALGAAMALAILVLASPWASARVQRELIRILEARFDGTVEIDEVALSLFPRLSIDGRGFTITQSRGDNRIALVHADRVHASGSVLHVLRRSIGLVEIEGLLLDVARTSTPSPKPTGRAPDLTIDEIRVSGGLLRILPDDPAKLPLHFQLSSVTFHDFSFDGAGRYTALLTNPKPEGVIRASGTFGPWSSSAPRSTPLAGEYEFRDARLATIKGIGGTLASTGTFNGVLERIQVAGATTTPDFQLDLAKQPVPLATHFRAIVDGTSGDTFLTEVNATLGTSKIVARGFVASAPGATGRTVSLDVRADGRFEDFLRLAVKARQPPMRGAISLNTSFVLPPGEADVPRRMRLQGAFRIRGGHFSSNAVQDKVDELSRRGRGEPENGDVSDVLAGFGGRFSLRDGRLSLPQFQFSVQGARVASAARTSCPISSSTSRDP